MHPTAVPTLTVLLDEFAQFWPDEAKPKDESEYRTAVFGKGQAALCLSGGGIRSAAFALGILQSLSRRGLLTDFHYLSTVSGGGYIGSWLQRWIAEARSAQAVMTALGSHTEPPEVKALRENSNYLTPRVGIGSNDTWTALALSIRNILINAMLFGPLFLLLGLFPNLVAAAIGARPTPTLAWTLLLAGATCLCWATHATCRLLPSYRLKEIEVPGAGDRYLNLHIVLPLALWGVLATIAVAPLLLEGAVKGPWLRHVAGANLLAMLCGVGLAWFRADATRRPVIAHDGGPWLLAGAVASLSLYFSALWTVQLTQAVNLGDHALEVLTTTGPILVTGAQFVATILFVVFRRAGTSDAPISPDADREWLARLTALKMKPALLWALVGFAAFGVGGLLHHLIGTLGKGVDLSLAGIFSLLSGATAVLGGRSSKTGGPTKPGAAAVLTHVPLRVIVSLATIVFGVALFTFHAGVEAIVAWRFAAILEEYAGWPAEWLNADVAAHLMIAAALAVVLGVLSQQISVNRFSLTGLYRNRLARAFLGGARRQRKPDPFTGFDPADNVRLHTLVRGAGDPPQCLYPVINVALNVTSAERLAWQERKAEPFVFTPLYSGSGLLTREEATPGDLPGAFVSSHCYGGNEPDLGLPDRGVTLATAMAISGAAASPNMGYNSSPATAFLMSLFNVRLGAWLPNPARAKSLGDAVGASGPSDNLRAMLRELAGSTQDSGRDIYLSDGGHFDNLGIYEMVRRRCRYMVVSDAGCDPECQFQDLGNAVRKVAIDQNVKIDFEPMHISGRGTDTSPQYAYALGRIDYPERSEPGHILYVKPSFFGQMPIDVRAYAAGSPSFPHETTGDQFFSESQFESYRALGQFFTAKLGGETSTLPAFFAALASSDGDGFRTGEKPIADREGGAIERRAPGGPGGGPA